MRKNSNLHLVDSHCHIDFMEFDHDRQKVIENALDLGVKKIIVPSVTKNTWTNTINTCERYSALELALGLHPIFIDQHQPQHLVELDKLIKSHRPIAVGEIGLDFYSKDLDRDKQIIFFTKQLIIAKQHELPIIIHNRKAHDECIEILQEIRPKGGIVHAFNGSIQQARKYIDLGFYLGFGGMITYDRSSKLRALLTALPIDRIVLETDAPDMTVSAHHGERNSPEYLPHIALAVAEHTALPIDQVAEITTRNVETLFAAQ